MSARSDAAKAFLGKGWVVKAAKNWYNFEITFNEAEESVTYYYREKRERGENNEEVFARSLMAYLEDLREKRYAWKQENKRAIRNKISLEGRSHGVKMTKPQVQNAYDIYLDADNEAEALTEYLLTLKNK